MDFKKQYREIKQRYYKKLTKTDNGIIHIGDIPTMFRRPEKDDWWGDWHLIEVNTLELITAVYGDNNSCWIYEVYLDEMKSSAKVLDVITQISHKSWCTETILSDLVWSLDDCLKLQENYCGFGTEHKGEK